MVEQIVNYDALIFYVAPNQYGLYLLHYATCVSMNCICPGLLGLSHTAAAPSKNSDVYAGV